jgi:hypothetical protein
MPDDFQERAVKCEEWAERAGNADARTAWAEMAQHWRGRAETSKHRMSLERDTKAGSRKR